jgi:small-conductance mechanosensitive channel
VVGIAVGFGAQSLVRDYFNGWLILLENQFSIGDVVSIAGVTGTVEDLTLRRTTIRDLDGVVHNVPNGEIKVASNRTRTWARINQDVTVAYGTDVDRATEVVDAVGREMAADPAWKGRIIEAPRVERVEALAEYGITLKILGTVQAVDQWAAGGELRKRLLAAFARHGIEIPRPQRVILARDPDGSGPRPPEAIVGPTGGDDVASS